MTAGPAGPWSLFVQEEGPESREELNGETIDNIIQENGMVSPVLPLSSMPTPGIKLADSTLKIIRFLEICQLPPGSFRLQLACGRLPGVSSDR